MDNELKELLEDSLKKMEKTIEDSLSTKEAETVATEEMTHGFKNENEFFKSVKNYFTGNAKDSRLAQKTINESVDSEGGLLVPPQMLSRLFMKEIEQTPLWANAFKIPMAGNSITIPYLVDNTHATTVHGITAYYKGESEEYTNVTPTFGEIGLKANKLTAAVKVTDEMLDDAAFSVAAIIRQKVPEVIRWKIDQGIINGNGAGQPLGILNSGCLVTVAKETSQTAATINVQNLLKMFARIPSSAQGRAVWIANLTTIPQLFDLNTGTGGTPLFFNNQGIHGVPQLTLLGRPIIFTEHCKTLGTAGDIYLADMSQYAIAYKTSGIQSAMSAHVRFMYDEKQYKFSFRFDGQPMWRTYLTPNNGDTISPFINLATRS